MLATLLHGTKENMCTMRKYLFGSMYICGGFLLTINILDVYVLPEVVWKFFLLLFALLFAKNFLFGVCVFWL